MTAHRTDEGGSTTSIRIDGVSRLDSARFTEELGEAVTVTPSAANDFDHGDMGHGHHHRGCERVGPQGHSSVRRQKEGGILAPTRTHGSGCPVVWLYTGELVVLAKLTDTEPGPMSPML